MPSTVHAWRIPSLSFSASITRADPSASNAGPPSFSIVIVDDIGTAIITALSITSYPGLDGIIISCEDGNVAPGQQPEIQNTTAMVFGEL